MLTNSADSAGAAMGFSPEDVSFNFADLGLDFPTFSVPSAGSFGSFARFGGIDDLLENVPQFEFEFPGMPEFDPLGLDGLKESAGSFASEVATGALRVTEGAALVGGGAAVTSMLPGVRQVSNAGATVLGVRPALTAARGLGIFGGLLTVGGEGFATLYEMFSGKNLPIVGYGEFLGFNQENQPYYDADGVFRNANGSPRIS